MQMHAATDRDLPSPGFATVFSASLDDVLQAMQEVLHDQIIHGTYVFEKQQTLTGAESAAMLPVEGVVVIFDSADGGIIANTLLNSRQLVNGSLSPERFWKLCLMDPPEAFRSTPNPQISPLQPKYNSCPFVPNFELEIRREVSGPFRNGPVRISIS